MSNLKWRIKGFRHWKCHTTVFCYRKNGIEPPSLDMASDLRRRWRKTGEIEKTALIQWFIESSFTNIGKKRERKKWISWQNLRSYHMYWDAVHMLLGQQKQMLAQSQHFLFGARNTINNLHSLNYWDRVTRILSIGGGHTDINQHFLLRLCFNPSSLSTHLQ